MIQDLHRGPVAKSDDVRSPVVYTIREFATLAGIGLHSAYQAAREGRIPSLRFGRRIVIPKAALDAMLDGHRSVTASNTAPE